jgi:hypothetical protein
MIAVGFWPLNRRLSLSLSAMTLLFISLPRVYAGGHYPIDVLFSCLLGILVLIAVWRWSFPVDLSNWSVEKKLGETIRDLVLFLWTFELGEGFRSVELLASMVRRIWWL